MNQIFVHFSIKGDLLDLEKIKDGISVNAKMFKKGEIYPNKYNIKSKLQKTNRWVYSLVSEPGENVNSVIKRMYADLSPFLDKIKIHTQKHRSLLDIVIYQENTSSRFNVTLSKRSVKIINSLNSKLSVTFIDF